MIFRVKLFCRVLLPEETVMPSGTFLSGVREPNHGTVYVRTAGTTNEEDAQDKVRALVKHRCHSAHGSEKCNCRAVPHEIERVSWEKEQLDQDRRTITARVIGGTGELLSWYPIGTKLSWKSQ